VQQRIIQADSDLRLQPTLVKELRLTGQISIS
jgi:hypothetical protein